MELTKFHAKYIAWELTKKTASDDPEKLASSLLDAQVDLKPHQLDAALFAFKSPLSKGAILADEVGLGKTIEAGLVISQKWAERKRKILVIVPSSLRKQWNQELMDKFFLPSIILETPNFKTIMQNENRNPFDQEKIVICSYHFARAKDIYLKQVIWDLVVLDEAHHLRNVYKPTNRIANAIKRALANVPKLLLTATPLQNSLLELFGLVSVIDEYTFGDLKSFKEHYSRPNLMNSYDDLRKRLKPICKRTLRRQVLEYIKYTKRIAITQEFVPTPQEQELYNLVSEYLQRDNLYALPSSQRQLMTLILRRLLASSTFAISGTLEALAEKLEKRVQEKEQEELGARISENFEAYQEIKDEWEDDDVGVEQNTEGNKSIINATNELERVREEIIDLKKFQALAESIVKNSKGEVLITALERGFDEIHKIGGNRKAVIFTESTRTQRYLEQILENSDLKGKLVLFNGSNSDPKSREIHRNWLAKHEGTDRISGSKAADMRAAIVEYFRDEATIMIATNAAAEGLNLQFCSLIVNYDLPWNPQRIEQRIGRCHRYGQQFDVVVVNFLNKKNAADQRVFQLLFEKFHLFSGVFGASDEILGSIESGVDFEKRIANIYQSCRTSDDIQNSFDQLQMELESSINEKMKDTRRKLLENFDEEVHEKLRVSLDKSNEYLPKYEKWLWLITEYYLKLFAHFNPNDTERIFYLNTNPFFDEPIQPGRYRLGKAKEGYNIYRLGHPLAQRIIEECKHYSLKTTELVFNYTDHDAKISIIEDLVGRSGWLKIINIAIEAFDIEDHIIFCGIIENGLLLDEEVCRRMFSLSAVESTESNTEISDAHNRRINDIASNHEKKIVDINIERNAAYFENEMEKLDKWAEDIKNSLEIKLKELDKSIRMKKIDSKKELDLAEKVKIQREINELERKRNTMRQDLFNAQDEVEQRKDNLLEEVEARMKQSISREDIFTIKWRIV